MAEATLIVLAETLAAELSTAVITKPVTAVGDIGATYASVAGSCGADAPQPVAAHALADA